MSPRPHSAGSAGARGSSRRSRRARRLHGRIGALTLVGLLFALSAATRLAEHSGQTLGSGVSLLTAWAQDAGDAEQTDSHVPTETSEAVVQRFLERERRIEERERELQEREHALRIARTELQSSIAAFEEAEASLRNMVALADGAAQADLDRLTRMYESMKPKDAAAVFETMDPAFAAGFLGQMAPNIAAEILAGLPPETAYTVSLVLAGRNMQANRPRPSERLP